MARTRSLSRARQHCTCGPASLDRLSGDTVQLLGRLLWRIFYIMHIVAVQAADEGLLTVRAAATTETLALASVMRMAVVLARVMRVGMAQRFMAMGMAVPASDDQAFMRMLVVQVMLMLVGMRPRFMVVRMLMALAQVQPHAQRHQAAGQNQAGADGLVQPPQRQQRAKERRDRGRHARQAPHAGVAQRMAGRCAFGG